MWSRWLPWRFVVSRLARSKGFIDPIAILSRLHRFAQPSEVTEPIELLRAGVVFHARGLINTRAIQHNLDWVWPYWIERQFNPHDPSFVPRAFSITHVNLTHRNWTAVGQPGIDWLPIVDPRGLVTPIYDAWSLDAWVILDDGTKLLPSRAADAEQRVDCETGMAVRTRVRGEGCELASIVDVTLDGGSAACRVRYRADAERPGRLAIGVRPMNPEGVSFIQHIEATDAGRRLRVNDEHDLRLSGSPQRLHMSCYRMGDVASDLEHATVREAQTCDVGLATAAATFPIRAGEPTEIEVTIPRPGAGVGTKADRPKKGERATAWPTVLQGHCRLRVPDRWMGELYDIAVRSLILHSPGEVYPGPYTYKRFWFRDAAFILHAMLALGLDERVKRCIDGFHERQTSLGYFLSQEGEWDSNGAALWIMHRYRQMTGEPLPQAWWEPMRRGAQWIGRKRLSDDLNKPHAGLMPAGFSAEHLGPNDFYYWDDFWSIAGLRCAADLVEEQGDARVAATARQTADKLAVAVERSLAANVARRTRDGLPASPYRRMDAGAIGSIACGYPLQLWPPREPRLLDTVRFLIDHCTVRGGFFQDMIHSGINAYLTLELAQVLIRADEGDEAFRLVQAVADLASPTGQWPEAIHPHTGGGCMGDGHHVWASAEWVLAMRHLFLREEGGTLVLGQGLPDGWLRGGEAMSFGPAPTAFGVVSVAFTPEQGGVRVRWDAEWRGHRPRVEIRLPGRDAVEPADDASEAFVPHERGAAVEATQ